MSKILLKDISFGLGERAYNAGRPRIPAADREFLKNVIAGLQVGEGIPYHKAWLSGWDYANLKAEKPREAPQG